MKRLLFVYLVTVSWSCYAFHASKNKVTIYNQSDSTILVALDTKERQPIRKDSIEAKQARNFYIPRLTEKQPFYLLIDSEGEQRLFTIHMVGKNIILRRGDQDIGSVPSSVFETTGLSLVIYGALFPYLPEAKIISTLSATDRYKILHPEEAAASEAEKAVELKREEETTPEAAAVFESPDSDPVVDGLSPAEPDGASRTGEPTPGNETHEVNGTDTKEQVDQQKETL